MKKLYVIFKIAVLEKLEYRVELLSGAFIELYALVLQMFLWKLIIGEQGNFSGYSYVGILLYYVLSKIFNTCSLGGRMLSKDFMKSIWKGELSKFLLKPISPKLFYIIKSFASQFVRSFIEATVLISFIIFTGSFKEITNLNFSTILILLLYIIFITIFNFLFYLVVACISFWTESGSGIRNVITLILGILKGTLFPIDIAPAWFVNLMKFLPFMYSSYYPAKIVISSQPIRDELFGILILILYSIFFFFLSKYLWVKGLKRYDSVGN